jgi:FkbM family methyltransferase
MISSDKLSVPPPRQIPHHPVFSSFDRTEPYSNEAAHYNFVGARISHDFEIDLAEASPLMDKRATFGLKASGRSSLYDSDETFPHRDSEDYFEWIDLLTSIERAEESFAMIEVGAGYGRWIANASASIQRLKGPRIKRRHFLAFEANQRRFEFMVRNCAENCIPPAEVELHRLACTVDGQPVLMKCDDDYGAKVIRNDALLANEAFQRAERVLAQDEKGHKFMLEKVPAVNLNDMLTRTIDFMDMDIQGAELEVLPGAMPAMCRNVKLAHIASHSNIIDARLAHLFHLHGWRPRYIFPCGHVNLTQFGEFRFIDGIQSWENPQFLRA